MAYTSSPSPSLSSASHPQELISPTSNAVLRIDKLPTIVVNEIFSYLKYEELAPCRLVDRFFQRTVEKRLNDAFMKLGRELNDFSSTLKRKLPRKESERKNHRFYKYAEIISAMETRHTLLSMTYKKYIDAGFCCFIPGKVLDLSFDVFNMIRGYVNREIYQSLNAISVMRDIRDYSTMATEHFDQYIVPILTKRLQDSSLVRRSLNNGYFISPGLRTTNTYFSSVLNFASTSGDDNDSPIPLQSNINKLSEQLDTCAKQLEDMRKLLTVHNNTLFQIISVLTETTEYISHAQASSIPSLAKKMKSITATLKDMLVPPIGTSTIYGSTSTERMRNWLDGEYAEQSTNVPGSSNDSSRYSLRNRCVLITPESIIPEKRKRPKTPSEREENTKKKKGASKH